ncbi:MAG: DNA polymerase III subunit gamma/tau [Candidatus Peribacteraceae bacterium]|nr:DNA polymerase III subunit gamma/tau [Candidatus Peribacteraceae bacterium]
MTLYLTYRPQTFADVVGQDHVVTTLEQAAEQERISHAYLLCGSRGTGKTSVARIMAKTILLRGIEDATIQKHVTQAIENGSFVDLVEIDAASNRRIDDVRDLIEKINFSPSVSKAKVYIIDEVHMLTKEAFNALLKTLEEPPDYAYFILATTELHKVPDTIQSRCQRFLFKRVKDEDIIRRLQFIADQEKIKIDREALRAIARHASGSFRDGISLMDQLRSLEKITLVDVSERIGKTSAVFIEDIASALAAKDIQAVTELVRQMEEANVPLDSVAADLLSLVRTQMHEAIEKKESPAPFLTMSDVLLATLKDMRTSPMPSLVLESALVSLCMDAPVSTKTSERIAITPPVLRVPSPPAPKPVAPEKTAEPTVKSAAVEIDAFTMDNVLRHWDAIGKAVTPPSVRMSLKDATIVSAEGTTLRLAFASSFHRDKIADTKASRSVEEALLTVFKKPIRIQCVLEKTAAANTGPATDLVEAAAEVFGGF